MHRRYSTLYLLLSSLFCAAAHADAVYNLNATLTDGGKVQGTLTFGTVTIPNFAGTGTITGMEVTAESFTIVGFRLHTLLQ